MNLTFFFFTPPKRNWLWQKFCLIFIFLQKESEAHYLFSCSVKSCTSVCLNRYYFFMCFSEYFELLYFYLDVSSNINRMNQCKKSKVKALSQFHVWEYKCFTHSRFECQNLFQFQHIKKNRFPQLTYIYIIPIGYLYIHVENIRFSLFRKVLRWSVV